MKRRKLSDTKNARNKTSTRTGDEDAAMWSRFGTDLPAVIFMDIALRLPIKSILACRCVCRTWRETVSDPEFAKLHFKRAKQGLILRTTEPSHVSRTLFTVELENYNFDYTCQKQCCFEEHLRINLDTKLKLPLRDSKMVLNGKLDAMAKAKFKGGSKSKKLMATKPRDDKYCIVNSCNGLICLSEPKGNNPVAVCNPVTGEYMQLTGFVNFSKRTLPINAGFGYCIDTNQYKAVRIYIKPVIPRDTGEWRRHRLVAEVQTLGSGLWEEVASTPKSHEGLKCPTYANGKVYWLLFPGFCYPGKVIWFDVKTEQFNSVALPKYRFEEECKPYATTMGVSGDSICICHASDRLRIWLMEDGAKNTWKTAFSIDWEEGRWPKYGSYYPMKLYDSGVLIFHTSSCLIYYDPKKSGFKYFRNQGSRSKFEAITYVPNLISLKNLITGEGAEVHNVQSRCVLRLLTLPDLFG